MAKSLAILVKKQVKNTKIIVLEERKK